MEISHGKRLTQLSPSRHVTSLGMYVGAAATRGHPEVVSWAASTNWTTSETQGEDKNSLKTAQTNPAVEKLADPP